MKDRKLSVEETRELLGGLSRNALYLLIRRGTLPSVEIGRRRFISASAISQFIAASTAIAGAPRPPIAGPPISHGSRRTDRVIPAHRSPDNADE